MGLCLDGLRLRNLQDLVARDTSESVLRLMMSLSRLANLVLSGGVPDFVLGSLYGASLTTLNKKEGEIRPFAVGSRFRRLTSKLAAMYASSRLAGFLKPKQLGVGVPGGCEAVIHAARHFVQSSNSSPTPQILVKVDVCNTFNTTDRSAFLRQLLEHSPKVYPLLRQAYGFSIPLFYGKARIHSETGLLQGDPLASLSFALVINSVVNSIDCPFNTWYLA